MKIQAPGSNSGRRPDLMIPSDLMGTHVIDYLAAERVLTLATASGWGLPYAAMFCYVNDGLTLYIWARPGNMTIRNIDFNPAISITIGGPPAGGRAAGGIQATGRAGFVLDPADIERVRRLAAGKFPSLLPSQPADLLFVRIQLSEIVPAGGDADGSQAAAFSRDLVHHVLGALPERQADTIAGRLGQVSVPAGASVVRQGQPAEKFFIILEGSVEVVREEAGAERVVALLGPGQFFGEVAILCDLPRTATVRAVTGVSLLTMDDRTFRSLVAQSLGITRDLGAVIRAQFPALSRSAG